MKVAIVSDGCKDSVLEKKILVGSIPDGLFSFSFDNQDKNLNVMVIEEETQIRDNYGEHFSNQFFKANMKKMIKKQNRMANQRVKKNM